MEFSRIAEKQQTVNWGWEHSENPIHLFSTNQCNRQKCVSIQPSPTPVPNPHNLRKSLYLEIVSWVDGISLDEVRAGSKFSMTDRWPQHKGEIWQRHPFRQMGHLWRWRQRTQRSFHELRNSKYCQRTTRGLGRHTQWILCPYPQKTNTINTFIPAPKLWKHPFLLT